MADIQSINVSVPVPAQLKNVADMVQGVVNQIQAGDSWMAVVSGVLPKIFAEGVQIDELKAELKDPSAATLAGLAIGAGVTAFLVAKAAKAVAAAAPAAAVAASNAAVQA